MIWSAGACSRVVKAVASHSTPRLKRRQAAALHKKQCQIVAELEAERKLVEANRELIARFEQKLQAKLAEIWGGEEMAAERTKDT